MGQWKNFNVKKNILGICEMTSVKCKSYWDSPKTRGHLPDKDSSDLLKVCWWLPGSATQDSEGETLSGATEGLYRFSQIPINIFVGEGSPYLLSFPTKIR